MYTDKIFKSIIYTDEFTVDDWNSLIDTIFGKYFKSDKIFLNNKEVLRTETINYIKFCENKECVFLFNWIFNQFKIAIQIDEKQAIRQISDVFYEISETDMKWMTNSILHPDLENFSERDKIHYYFKSIDDMIEGCFKPRFFLLYKFTHFNKYKSFKNVADKDFGQLVNEFSTLDSNVYNLLLKDPILNITINQWRNISAHKSFKVEKDEVIVWYGKKTIQTQRLTYKQLYDIISWIMNVYRVLRLAEVLIDLNFIKEIVDNLGGTDKIKLRFESSMMHLIHNMQIVGFEFLSTEENRDTYIVKFKKKSNHNLNESVIHASQSLDQLSHALSIDEFIKDKFIKVEVQVVDQYKKLIASANVKVDIALKRSKGEITLKEYISSINFNVTNYF